MEPLPNRYAIPLTTLVAGARVPVAEQVEVQDEVQGLGTPLPSAGGPHLDGGGGDVDGD